MLTPTSLKGYVMENLIGKVHCADCLDILRQLPDKSIDLILTDPPYGLGIDGQKESKSKNPKHNRKGHEKKDWDSCIPDVEIFREMQRVSKNMIVWGANYFNEYLEQGHKGWIIWDKGQDGLTMSDCEIAYTNFDVPTRIVRMNRVELLKDKTIHPTQKPLKLFEWVLARYSKKGDIVLDCFSGSGTTAVACHNLGRRFICIEKDPDYAKASQARVSEAQKELFMF